MLLFHSIFKLIRYNFQLFSVLVYNLRESEMSKLCEKSLKISMQMCWLSLLRKITVIFEIFDFEICLVWLLVIARL